MSETERPPVPAEIAARIRLIGALTDEQHQGLAKLLDGSEFFGSQDQLRKSAVALLGDEEVASEVIDVVLGFANAAAASDTSPVARKVTDSLAGDLYDSELSISAEEFSDRLLSLFAAPAVITFAQSRHLARAHSRLWMRAAITPELRPVFDPNDEGAVRAMVPWQLLRVEYVDDLQHRENKFVEFAMDHRDLVDLRSEIDRALARQRVMQETLLSVGVATWDPVEGSGESVGEDRE